MCYNGIIKEPQNHPHLNICIYESKNLDSNELQEMYNNFIGFFCLQNKIDPRPSRLKRDSKSGVVVTLSLVSWTRIDFKFKFCWKCRRCWRMIGMKSFRDWK